MPPVLTSPSLPKHFLHRHLLHRHFSASAPRSHYSLLQLAVDAPTAVLDGVHAMGLPWCAAIPLSAALVRCTLVYYSSTKPGRKREITRTHLFPLAQVRANISYENWANKMENEELQLPRLVLAAKRITTKLIVTHRLGKMFKAPLFSFTAPLNFITLIAFAEAIRVKCGTREGLLSTLLHPFDETLHRLEGTQTAQEKADEALAQRLEAQQAFHDINAPDFVDSSYNIAAQSLRPPIQPPAYAEYADPTLATEGIAWFPDLTVPDPQGLIPLALGAVFLAGVNWKKVTRQSSINQRPTSAQHAVHEQQRNVNADINAALKKADELRATTTRKNKKEWSPFGHLTFGDRTKIAMAGIFTIVSMKLPVAIVLYIMTNTIVGRLQKRWLDIKYPLPTLIHPCKRPMRIKVRRTFRGD
ncbi:hypothetical protein AC578_10540 [Pseudocercospora eumusae]|uniref:Uncharacterized protein n=1 Tax=Pseudocercospora eumusae TaxID=321146 RepID=A0A139H612_9PEZI|nr:hypothetical protein AC578_10540 [Pseudocercospora eumusae]